MTKECQSFKVQDQDETKFNIVHSILFFNFIFFYFSYAQMLTCVNPTVEFKMKFTTVKYFGFAVALKWLLSLVKNFGGSHPSEDKIRREIHTLSIGDGRGQKKSHFNKFANGTKITRGAGGVEVTSRSCIVVKHSCFGTESWKVFSEGM